MKYRKIFSSIIANKATIDYMSSDYWPDGTLRSRFTQTRRIDPVSATNLNTNLTTGTAEPMAVSPNLRTTRRYRGSFEIVSGAENFVRVNTSTGYYDCKEKRHYYHLTNRQGSVMAVIDDQGTTVQRTGLYPSGTPFILPSDYGKFIANSTQTLTSATDRLHIGNRWLGHSGLNRYDNTARLHDPLLCRFDTPDPLATKFPNLNPWTHTAANPANLVDLDGFKPTTLQAALMAENVYEGEEGDEIEGDWYLQKVITDPNSSSFRAGLYSRKTKYGKIESRYVKKKDIFEISRLH